MKDASACLLLSVLGIPGKLGMNPPPTSGAMLEGASIKGDALHCNGFNASASRRRSVSDKQTSCISVRARSATSSTGRASKRSCRFCPASRQGRPPRSVQRPWRWPHSSVPTQCTFLALAFDNDLAVGDSFS